MEQASQEDWCDIERATSRKPHVVSYQSNEIFIVTGNVLCYKYIDVQNI